MVQGRRAAPRCVARVLHAVRRLADADHRDCDRGDRLRSRCGPRADRRRDQRADWTAGGGGRADPAAERASRPHRDARRHHRHRDADHRRERRVPRAAARAEHHLPRENRPQEVRDRAAAAEPDPLVRLVISIGFLLLVSLIVSAALTALANRIEHSAVGGPVVLQVLNVIISLAVMTLLFGLIYRLLPDVRLAWRDVWMGASVTSVLFAIGKFVIGLYLGHSSVA